MVSSTILSIPIFWNLPTLISFLVSSGTRALREIVGLNSTAALAAFLDIDPEHFDFLTGSSSGGHPYFFSSAEYELSCRSHSRPDSGGSSLLRPFGGTHRPSSNSNLSVVSCLDFPSFTDIGSPNYFSYLDNSWTRLNHPSSSEFDSSFSSLLLPERVADLVLFVSPVQHSLDPRSSRRIYDRSGHQEAQRPSRSLVHGRQRNSSPSTSLQDGRSSGPRDGW